MPIKDWEKQRENKNLVTWTNQVRSGELLEIQERRNGKWRVIFIDGNDVDVLKQGLTKSQALAFARSYMRRN